MRKSRRQFRSEVPKRTVRSLAIRSKRARRGPALTPLVGGLTRRASLPFGGEAPAPPATYGAITRATTFTAATAPSVTLRANTSPTTTLTVATDPDTVLKP